MAEACGVVTGEMTDRLAPYNALIDVADVHGWRTFLGCPKSGLWAIEVRDHGELLARSVRRDLADAARVCGRALEKSGRIN